MVYEAAQEEKKRKFLIELGGVCADQKHSHSGGGEFNFLRFAGEKKKNFHNSSNYDTFNSIIHAYELREIVMSGDIFT